MVHGEIGGTLSKGNNMKKKPNESGGTANNSSATEGPLARVKFAF